VIASFSGDANYTASTTSCATPTAAVTVTLPTPTAAQIKALLLTEMTPTGKAARTGALLKASGYRVSFTALLAGHAKVEWYYLPAGAHLVAVKPTPLLVARGSLTLSAAGTGKLTVKLTTGGRKLLKRVQTRHAHTLKLTAKAAFTPTGRPAVLARKTFTLRP
jgi:hypothetical protein